MGRWTEWQKEMTANKWSREAVKWSWRWLTLTLYLRVFFFFLLFSPLTCILFYILTLVHCINLLFFVDFPSLSLWVMFRAAARWNKTVCSSKMPRNKVFQILLETNIFWVCYCICVGRMYCVLVHTMRRHIQYLYYWMCVFVCIQKCLRQLKKLLYRILSLMVSTLTFSNLRCFFLFFFKDASQVWIVKKKKKLTFSWQIKLQVQLKVQQNNRLYG